MALFEKKAETAVPPEVATCEREIAALERRKDERLKQIGLMFLYNNKQEDLAGTPYEESAADITVIEKKIDFYEKRKLAVQGKRKCEKCGCILPLDSAFCNKCGERLEPLFMEEMKNQGVCPQCGARYESGAAFCTSCGNKLQ